MQNKIDSSNFENLPNKCVLNIQAIYQSLKTAEKKAAYFILSNPEKIKKISIDDFSNEAGRSKATIVRVSGKLGYKGFQELKFDFSRAKNKNDFWEYEDILKTDEPFNVMQKVFESSVKSIKDTLKIINKIDFLKALGALVNAKKIMFCGIGDATLVAMEAYQRFTRLGIDCYTDMDPDIQLLKSSQLKKYLIYAGLPKGHKKSDVFFAISYSGRSKPVIECTKIARDVGASAFYVGHILADFIWYLIVGFIINTGRKFFNQKVYI